MKRHKNRTVCIQLQMYGYSVQLRLVLFHTNTRTRLLSRTIAKWHVRQQSAISRQQPNATIALNRLENNSHERNKQQRRQASHTVLGNSSQRTQPRHRHIAECQTDTPIHLQRRNVNDDVVAEPNKQAGALLVCSPAAVSNTYTRWPTTLSRTLCQMCGKVNVPYQHIPTHTHTNTRPSVGCFPSIGAHEHTPYVPTHIQSRNNCRAPLLASVYGERSNRKLLTVSAALLCTQPRTPAYYFDSE